MSYAADHMAWQQRVNQEFNAASRFVDRMYSTKMSTGSNFGSQYMNPMGQNTMYGGASQMMYAPKSSGSYVAKSRLKDGSNASVRSKSMRSGMSRRSHLSKRKPTKRFNEELDVMSRRSKPSHHPSRPSVRNYRPQIEKPAVVDKKKQVMEKVEKMEDNIEKLRSTFNLDQDQKPEEAQDELARAEEPAPEEEKELTEEERKAREDQELNDEIDSLYYGSNYTESRRSVGSRRSQLTSATYISKLEKELQEERRAREKLAQELEEIKKISSEISSHLGLKQVMEGNQQ
jgi:hypothetical protein